MCVVYYFKSMYSVLKMAYFSALFRYLLQIMMEANCLEIASLISVLLKDALALIRIVNAARSTTPGDANSPNSQWVKISKKGQFLVWRNIEKSSNLTKKKWKKALFILHYTHFLADPGYPKIGFQVPVLLLIFLPKNWHFRPQNLKNFTKKFQMRGTMQFFGHRGWDHFLALRAGGQRVLEADCH